MLFLAALLAAAHAQTEETILFTPKAGTTTGAIA